MTAFSLARHWRNPACANEEGALRKSHWRNDCANSLFPLARHWRAVIAPMGPLARPGPRVTRTTGRKLPWEEE